VKLDLMVGTERLFKLHFERAFVLERRGLADGLLSDEVSALKVEA
jgi:hypothetical protein